MYACAHSSCAIQLEYLHAYRTVCSTSLGEDVHRLLKSMVQQDLLVIHVIHVDLRSAVAEYSKSKKAWSSSKMA